MQVFPKLLDVFLEVIKVKSNQRCQCKSCEICLNVNYFALTFRNIISITVSHLFIMKYAKAVPIYPSTVITVQLPGLKPQGTHRYVCYLTKTDLFPSFRAWQLRLVEEVCMRNFLSTPRLTEQRPHGSESFSPIQTHNNILLTSTWLQKSELDCCQECLVAQSDVEICHFSSSKKGGVCFCRCATTLLAKLAVD